MRRKKDKNTFFKDGEREKEQLKRKRHKEGKKEIQRNTKEKGENKVVHVTKEQSYESSNLKRKYVYRKKGKNFVHSRKVPSAIIQVNDVKAASRKKSEIPCHYH